MLGLQILINGGRLRTAGTAGAVNVCLTVDALGEELRQAKPGLGPVVLRLGGLSNTQGERRGVLQWLDGHHCGIGDEITIRVVEVGAGEVDQPTRTPLEPGMEKMLVPRTSLARRIVAHVIGWLAAGRRKAG